ncbi:hypothetical protein HPB50_028936 [Hyalomma asiaticum]|nr:hypothetical protein HPB50_028936 [Hyalomma asiaticum]
MTTRFHGSGTLSITIRRPDRLPPLRHADGSSSPVAMRYTTLVICFASFVVCSTATDRPIIGVISQHLYSHTYNPNRTETYIAASYVKYVEASGGRVVPVFVNQTKDYYKKLFNSINGVLLPGGEADLNSSGYLSAAKIIFDLAIEANKNGTHFPLWGTCLGFEALSRLAIDKLVLRECQGHDLALPLKFTSGEAGPIA